jgi:hypothetical protein
MIRPAPAAQPWLWSTNWIAWSAGAAPAPVAGPLALAHAAAGLPPAAPAPAREGVLAAGAAAWFAARSPDDVAAQPPRRPTAASAAAAGKTARVRSARALADRSGLAGLLCSLISRSLRWSVRRSSRFS